MNKIVFLYLLLLASTTYAQQELWGIDEGAYNGNPATDYYYSGNIYKLDINGENPVSMHQFDFANGKNPKGNLFLASNGKLYGIAYNGGNTIPIGAENGLGVLYEYDLVLNKYRVVHYFTDFIFDNPYRGTGVIEPVLGKIYGVFGNSRIFCYDLNTQGFTVINGRTEAFIDGELMKASNGFLYGTTHVISACSGTGSQSNYGSIFKIDITTNTLTTIYRFNCNFTDGVSPTGGLIEALPGKLYGTAQAGGNGSLINYGTIFEYNINTNVFTKKLNFDDTNLGKSPSAFANGNNGKLYSVCQEGGTFTYNGTDYHQGTLFEYNPSTNAIVKLHDFFGGTAGNYSEGNNPISLIRLSNNRFAGIQSKQGVISNVGEPFIFNPITNTVTTPCYYCYYISNPWSTPPRPLINLTEICRKPFYQEIVVNNFDVCTGSAFTYNIQNTNATSYQWKKDTTVLNLQTTSVLNLTNVSFADAGAYTCVMTNECGTTTTMPLNITVNCLGTNTIANLDKAIKLYPNPAKEILNIELPTNIDVIINGCTVTNLLGQTFSQTFTNNKIDVSQLQKGIYIIFLQTNYGKWNGKFVKN